MATYSFQDWQATIVGPGGSFPIGASVGVDDEGITTSFVEEKNTMKIGSDGKVMHSLHAGQGGKYTVRLQKTSPTNAQLNALYYSQSQSSANWGQNTISMQNLQTGETIVGQQAAFAKHPDLVYAKEGNMNDWEFNVGVHTPTLATY